MIHSGTCRCSAGLGGSYMICSQVQPGAGAQVLKVKEHKGLGGRWYIQAGAGAEQGGAGVRWYVHRLSQVQVLRGSRLRNIRGFGGRWYIQAGAGAEQGGAGGFRGRMQDAEASHSLLSPSRPSSPMGVQENQTIVIFFWYEIQKVKESWPGPKSSIVLTQ